MPMASFFRRFVLLDARFVEFAEQPPQLESDGHFKQVIRIGPFVAAVQEHADFIADGAELTREFVAHLVARGKLGKRLVIIGMLRGEIGRFVRTDRLKALDNEVVVVGRAHHVGVFGRVHEVGEHDRGDFFFHFDTLMLRLYLLKRALNADL